MSAGASTPTPGDGEDRLTRKRRAILEAAVPAFLSHGYLGTSMDEVAELAHVSKQTVYKHFSDKERLFVEIVNATVNEASDAVYEEVLHLRDSGDVDADLRDHARRQLARVMRPQLLELRRLVIAEANRFPELGRTFYDLGPGRTIEALAATFDRLAARGALRIGDSLAAAEQFNWLIMSAPINRAMLLGAAGTPAPAELDRHADEGVRIFLAAYGTAPTHRDQPPAA